MPNRTNLKLPKTRCWTSTGKCINVCSNTCYNVPSQTKTWFRQKVPKECSEFSVNDKWFFWDSVGTILILFLQLQGGAAAFGRRPSLALEEQSQKEYRVSKESCFICWNLGALLWDSFLIVSGLFWGRLSIHGITCSADCCFWLNQVFPWEHTL